jgi:hypothetical protein|tara:strand:+ start:210 stop:425 length:216 start_codon:yes stop_codon:yes gene_type:complete
MAHGAQLHPHALIVHARPTRRRTRTLTLTLALIHAQENLAAGLENPPVVQLGAAAVAGVAALAAVGQVLLA